MTYFDQELLLVQNLPEPTGARYGSLEEIISQLEASQKNLGDLEKSLAIDWAFGKFSWDGWEIMGLIYLKQLLLFIKKEKPRLPTLIKELKSFHQSLDIPPNVVYSLNSYKLRDFTFKNKPVVDNEVSINMLVERLTMLTRSPRSEDFLEKCLKTLFHTLPDVQDTVKSQIIELNNPEIIGALIKLYRPVEPDSYAEDLNSELSRELKQKIFDHAVYVNKQLIKNNKINTNSQPRYIESMNLSDWNEDENDEKIKQQITTIAIDILNDAIDKPFFTEELQKTYYCLFTRLCYLLQDVEITDKEDCQNLKIVFTKVATNQNIHINYRLKAMITACQCVNFIVPNRDELMGGIRNNLLEEERDFPYALLIYDKLSDNQLILDCLSAHQYIEDIIEYLTRHKKRFIKDSEKTTQLFDAFCLFLQKECEKPHFLNFFRSIQMILAYPLTLEQKRTIAEIIKNAITKQANEEYARILDEGLELVKEAIASDARNADALSYQDKSLSPSNRMMLYMQAHNISINDLINRYIACELFLHPEKITIPEYSTLSEANGLIFEALEDSRSTLSYDPEYIQSYPHEMNDMDILTDLLRLIPLEVTVLETTQYENLDYENTFDEAMQEQRQHEKAVSKKSIALDDFLQKKPYPMGFYRFEYNGQHYHFNSYDFFDVLDYVGALANQFLADIKHSKSLCQMGSMEDGGVSMLAVNLTKFKQLPECLRIGLKEIDFS